MLNKEIMHKMCEFYIFLKVIGEQTKKSIYENIFIRDKLDAHGFALLQLHLCFKNEKKINVY